MKVLRFLLCFAASFAFVYLNGKIASDIVYSTPEFSFFVAVLVFAVLAFAFLETYLRLKNKVGELSHRVEQLEEILNDNEK